jgi:hypothetical protein
LPFNAALFTAVLGGPGTGGEAPDVWLVQPAPEIVAKSNTKHRINSKFGSRTFTPPFGWAIESVVLLRKYGHN